MRIGTVLTATDLNPLYCDFIPIFIRAWKAVLPEANIVIILIANEIPEQFREYAEYIRVWSPIPNIHTAFQAQCIRLLYPALIEDSSSGVIITDMDMLPTSRRYYVNNIADLPSDAFINYKNTNYNHLQMCYNVAHPQTWATIFNINGVESIISTLETWYKDTLYDGEHGGKGWGTDEINLTKKVNEWTGNKIVLDYNQTGFVRLCRSRHGIFKDRNLLRLHLFTNKFKDFHALRPYNANKQDIDFVIQQVEQSYEVKTAKLSTSSLSPPQA
jgi:hypothetical protein